MTDLDIQYQEFLSLTWQTRQAGKRWLTLMAELYVKTEDFQYYLQTATNRAKIFHRNPYATTEVLVAIGERWLGWTRGTIDADQAIWILESSHPGIYEDLGRILLLANYNCAPAVPTL